MRKAVYAGSFDPITIGHLWMVEKGALLFDELLVAIGDNPEKKYAFTLEDRLQMLKDSVAHIPGVSVSSFENAFLVNYAKSVGARYILRGIRDAPDFEYERRMRHINNDLQPEITTIFLMPPREIAEFSSSLVKSLIGPDGWREVVKDFVPLPVYNLILEKYGNR